MIYHSPNKMRTRSSTARSVDALIRPNRWTSRSVETERRASHRTVQSTFVPPSGARIATCMGMSRIRLVIGTTRTSFAGPWLKASTEKMRTVLRPACSCPRVGFRSASQISPRCGVSLTDHPAAWRPKPRSLSSIPAKPARRFAVRQTPHCYVPRRLAGDASRGLVGEWRPPSYWFLARAPLAPGALLDLWRLKSAAT